MACYNPREAKMRDLIDHHCFSILSKTRKLLTAFLREKSDVCGSMPKQNTFEVLNYCREILSCFRFLTT